MGKRQILVTAGVIWEQGRFLLARRYPDDPEGDKWEFPGGKIEWGEDLRCGLKRELNEELGVTATVGSLLETVSVVRGALHLVLLYFECRIDAGRPRAVASQQIDWFAPQQIDDLPKLPADEVFWLRYRTHHGMIAK